MPRFNVERQNTAQMVSLGLNAALAIFRFVSNRNLISEEVRRLFDLAIAEDRDVSVGEVYQALEITEQAIEDLNAAIEEGEDPEQDDDSPDSSEGED